MNEREILEYRHLASNSTLAALFDEEERRLTQEIIAASGGDDNDLRNAAIALKVITAFRRKLNQRAQRASGKDET